MDKNTVVTYASIGLLLVLGALIWVRRRPNFDPRSPRFRLISKIIVAAFAIAISAPLWLLIFASIFRH